MSRSMLGRWSLLLILGLTLSGCKYDDPGQEGRRPQREPDWTIMNQVDEVLPEADAIPCGEVRSIHLSLSQTVTACAGYNFRGLYQRTKALVDLRASQVLCTQGACTIKQSYYTHWSWNCNGTKATVNVKAKVRCLDAPANLPANAGDGSNMNFGAAAVTNATGETGAVAPPPPAKGEVMVIEGNAPPTAPLVLCDQRVLLTLTYRRKTSNGGAPPFGYESYVDEATAKARLLHGSFVCEAPCRKQDFRPLYTSWRLSGNDVVMVTVIFEVDCRRP